MKHSFFSRGLILVIALVLLGGALLPFGILYGRSGVTVERVREGAISRTVYRPDVSRERLVPTAVIVGRASDGGAALALELARRGVTTALCPDVPSAEAAWDILASEEHTLLASMGLIGIGGGTEELLAFAESLVGLGRECAALCLLSDEVTPEEADSSAARNVLLITAAAEDEPIRGYFSDGSARRVAALPLRADTREALLLLIDWLGSSLGHSIGLEDADLTVLPRRALLTAGTLSLGAGIALGAVTLSRKKKDSETNKIEKESIRHE